MPSADVTETEESERHLNLVGPQVDLPQLVSNPSTMVPNLDHMVDRRNSPQLRSSMQNKSGSNASTIKFG